MLDEKALRELIQSVARGDTKRRDFLRTMATLGVSGVLANSLIAGYSPAMAQTKTAEDEFTPTKRGGGGELKLLWWQAPTILNVHLASAARTMTLHGSSMNL